MRSCFWTSLLATALTVWTSTATLAQPTSEDGPPPSEDEFWEAADRAVRRVYRDNVQRIEWSVPARDIDTGGYAVCGTVSLRGRVDGLPVLSHWYRGDVATLMVTAPADHAADPYADGHDMRWPGMVFPIDDLSIECASLAGEGAATWRGEPFEWREPPSAPVAWTETSRTTGELSSPCIPLSTEPGRRYRVRAESSLDAYLMIASDCAGANLLRWNEDTSPSNRNPTVEFEGRNEVYAIVNYRDSWAPYTLTVEEARQE